MIVLDASVALKWFAGDEPLAAEASSVLETLQQRPEQFLVPEIFFSECLAVLCRMRGATVERVREALTHLESLGMTRIASGHDLLQLAAEYAIGWKLSGYDAIYVALAALTDAVWLTADGRAARRVGQPALVRVLGS